MWIVFAGLFLIGVALFCIASHLSDLVIELTRARQELENIQTILYCIKEQRARGQ
jgi:hypothetical protein